ncbi:hypothetical protein T440DRAFT_29282 [Plenodomus tracheiphilus IPT5]|uniref:Uncharacterized protein n=1 Tax=Plenodomus tracheiphilus IPT5 TaxID=1408161 RepID=A0A6A7BAW0_9PLEO|nr:hypothetical protein T440DRAFT_29282 [Plenodomus tracheiphilus IPT5]
MTLAVGLARGGQRRYGTRQGPHINLAMASQGSGSGDGVEGWRGSDDADDGSGVEVVISITRTTCAKRRVAWTTAANDGPNALPAVLSCPDALGVVETTGRASALVVQVVVRHALMHMELIAGRRLIWPPAPVAITPCLGDRLQPAASVDHHDRTDYR